MTKAVKDDVQGVLEKLKTDKVPMTLFAIGPKTYHKYTTRATIKTNGKRTVAILFYGLDNIEEFTLSYDEFVSRYKMTQEYFDKKWLRESWQSYVYVIRDRFEIAIYEDNKMIAKCCVAISEFTGNCGARAWTGIPLGLNVDEWEFINKFLSLTYPTVGLFLASHNTGTINNYLQPMIKSGWKQTEPVYNPNSTNNIAVLMLAINQPKTIK